MVFIPRGPRREKPGASFTRRGHEWNRMGNARISPDAGHCDCYPPSALRQITEHARPKQRPAVDRRCGWEKPVRGAVCRAVLRAQPPDLEDGGGTGWRPGRHRESGSGPRSAQGHNCDPLLAFPQIVHLAHTIVIARQEDATRKLEKECVAVAPGEWAISNVFESANRATAVECPGR